MNAAFYVYLASVLPNMSFLMFIFGFTGLVCWSISCASNGEFRNKYICVLTVSLIFLSGLIPSERTMYLMAGAHLGEKIIDSKVGKQTVELIELKLEEELKKLKNK